MVDVSYRGAELNLFKEARNWKAYVRDLIAPYLGREVLEVGAGIGATTEALCSEQQKRWLCLEPDPDFGAHLRLLASRHELPSACQIKTGTVQDLESDEMFDSILYIDVLEHIARDQTELEAASAHLRANGCLIVLSPAHQYLYTPFDRAIGHYRRYDKSALARLGPASLKTIELKYVDSVGAIASLGNKVVLKSALPTAKQLMLWDRLMVPLSKFVDPLLRYRAGKSILAVWRKDKSAASAAG